MAAASAPATSTTPGRRSGHRHMPAAKFVGAAHFDADAGELGPVDLIRIVRSQPLLSDLLTNTDFSVDGAARDREPGHWALAFIAFAASPIPDMRPWWRDSSADLWWEAGFESRPSYHQMYRRFTELETSGGIQAMSEASTKLIRLAIVASGGIIGRDVMVDASEAEANARMFHDCQDGENCPTLANRKKNHKQPKSTRTAATMHVDEAKTIRQNAAEVLPDVDHEPITGDGEKLYFDQEREVVRIRIADHWWTITDATAGCRTHETKGRSVKSWIGWTDMKGIDMACGLSMAAEIDSCSIPEYDIYPALYEKLKDILSGVPRAVLADKGLAIKRVMQMHSDDGVFSVLPFRGSKEEPEPADHERWDRHGVPRCENCGGTTRFVSFTKTPNARVMFECITKPHAECAGRQQLRCSEDPRYLLPLWRNSSLYASLKHAGMEYERAHRLARQRHGAGGDNSMTRAKRKGANWQQLIANTAILVDWLKLDWRNGWLPGTTCKVTPDATFFTGKGEFERFEAEYLEQGLHTPYGERAAALDPTGRTPWRLTQADRVQLKAGGKQEPLPRPLGGPRRRALTQLPADSDKRVASARKRFFADQAASTRKPSSKTTPTPGTDTNSEGVASKNIARAQAAKKRASPPSPS